MARWEPQREDVLAEIAAEILHNYGTGRTLVAVDGREGSGQAGFADGLVEAIATAGTAAARLPMSAFAVPDAADPYGAGFDYEDFRRTAVAPFRGGEALLPELRDRVAPPGLPDEVPANAVLVVDGVFLNRPEISGIWKYSLWLHVPQELTEQRLRHAGVPEEDIERAQAAQARYRSRLDPSAVATAIVDNSHPEHPRRIFADSC
jgi:uridine kinase